MEKETRTRPASPAGASSPYRRMIDSTGFWLGATIYIVVLAALVLWLYSLGFFRPWMVALMFVTFGLAFAVALSTFLRLRRMDREQEESSRE